jgi:hypothetical protein
MSNYVNAYFINETLFGAKQVKREKSAHSFLTWATEKLDASQYAKNQVDNSAYYTAIEDIFIEIINCKDTNIDKDGIECIASFRSTGGFWKEVSEILPFLSEDLQKRFQAEFKYGEPDYLMPSKMDTPVRFLIKEIAAYFPDLRVFEKHEMHKVTEGSRAILSKSFYDVEWKLLIKAQEEKKFDFVFFYTET